MQAIESITIKADIWLQVKAEYPWRVRAYGKPLWLALLMHPFHIRIRRGVIYIREIVK